MSSTVQVSSSTASPSSLLLFAHIQKHISHSIGTYGKAQPVSDMRCRAALGSQLFLYKLLSSTRNIIFSSLPYLENTSSPYGISKTRLGLLK